MGSVGQGRIFIAGHRGMVGSALLGQLADADVITRDSSQLDLTRQADVEDFFQQVRIDTVYLAAARVGGIKSNDEFPADFIRDNLLIQANVIDSAYRAGVKRLLFLASSCIYPRLAVQPISEDALMTGPLESTNDAYAVAKIAGIKMCESYRRQHGCDFRSVMPTNLYGPNDNFDLLSSHVLPALLRKFYQAVLDGQSTVSVWGSGEPRREFLHVDDMAQACCYLMEMPEEQFWRSATAFSCHINVGIGTDIRIADLAKLVARITGFNGAIRFDTSMPDGTPRKLLDVSRLNALGWQANIPLETGIGQTFEWMKANWGRLAERKDQRKSRADG